MSNTSKNVGVTRPKKAGSASASSSPKKAERPATSSRAGAIDFPSKAHVDFLFNQGREAFAKMFGVKVVMVGELKVKDTSALIYKGRVFPVLGLYMIWPNVGLHSDGWHEYRVSLVGTEFEESHGYDETTISTGDIEWVRAKPWKPTLAIGGAATKEPVCNPTEAKRTTGNRGRGSAKATPKKKK